MFRVFHDHWKTLFMKKYPSESDYRDTTSYDWIPSTRRENIKEFWVNLKIEGINRDSYDSHEYILFKLICNTYSDLKEPKKSTDEDKDPKKSTDDDNLESHGINIPDFVGLSK